MVVRLHEFHGASGKVSLTSDYEIESWQHCDLMERPEGERRFGCPLEIEVSPYEILTFLITWKPAKL